MPQRQQTWKTTANNFKHEELHFYFCKMFFCTVNWSEHEACKFESGLRNVFQQCNEKKKLEQENYSGKLEISKETFAQRRMSEFLALKDKLVEC